MAWSGTYQSLSLLSSSVHAFFFLDMENKQSYGMGVRDKAEEKAKGPGCREELVHLLQVLAPVIKHFRTLANTSALFRAQNHPARTLSHTLPHFLP